MSRISGLCTALRYGMAGRNIGGHVIVLVADILNIASLIYSYHQLL